MSVRNIIFDLGGVLYDISFDSTAKAFKDLGVGNFDQLYSRFSQDALIDGLETGKLSPEAFREGFRERTGLAVSGQEIDRAWNALLVGFKAHRIDLLKQVRKHYSIYLLSNSNRIHYEQFSRELQQQFGYNSLDELFKVVWFSHEVGLRKPDREIFEYVIKQGDLDPGETLFIDDTPGHVESAARTGLLTRHLRAQEGEDVSVLFDSRGLLKEEYRQR